MQKRFWVFDWLAENGIKSLGDARKLLSKSKALQGLRNHAETYHHTQPKADTNDLSLVAGTGIDLSGGSMVCPSPTCMRAQVDTLFRRVWHYFDSIVVTDMSTPAILDAGSEDPSEPFLMQLPAILYIREIGAENLVEFVPRTQCSNWQSHAKEEGLSRLLAMAQMLKRDLRQNGSFLRERGPEDIEFYCITSPDLASRYGIPAEGRAETELQEQVLDETFDEYSEALTADVRVANRLHLPLGTVIPLHAKMMAASQPPGIADVAFSLKLPILDGVPTKRLIELRQQEHDSFIQFRKSLTIAVTERLNQKASSDAQSIAEEIRLDIVEPSLSRIRQRLAASQRALTTKTGAALFLGALGTTCGMLCGLPAAQAVSAGTALAITGTGMAAQKAIDDRRDISLEHMYFLWDAVHASH